MFIKNKKFRKRVILSFIAILLTLIGLATGLALVQQNQNIEEDAAPSCQEQCIKQGYGKGECEKRCSKTAKPTIPPKKQGKPATPRK